MDTPYRESDYMIEKLIAEGRLAEIEVGASVISILK